MTVLIVLGALIAVAALLAAIRGGAHGETMTLLTGTGTRSSQGAVRAKAGPLRG